MSDDATRRRPGRPKLADHERPGKCTVRLPPKIYDRVDREARRQGISVPAFIRRNLPKTLPTDDDDEE